MARRRDIEAGKAFVRLGLKDELTPQLKSALGDAKKIITQFATAAAGAFTTVTAAVSASVAEFAAAGSQLLKLSKQTGVAVESLSKLQFAAKKTGVEFDDITGAIEELQIRLGEAVRDGTGPLAETFKRLGLNANEIAAMPLPERFAAIANELRKINDPSLRQFSADEIFGGDAFKILPLLEADMAALTERAEELGVVMDERTAQAAAELAQGWRDIQESMKGASRQFAAGLVDATSIETALEGIADAIAAIDWQAWGQQAAAALRLIAGGLIWVGRALQEVQAGFNSIQKGTIDELAAFYDMLPASAFGGEDQKAAFVGTLRESSRQFGLTSNQQQNDLKSVIDSMEAALSAAANPSNRNRRPRSSRTPLGGRRTAITGEVGTDPRFAEDARFAGMRMMGVTEEDETADVIRRQRITPQAVTANAMAAQIALQGGGSLRERELQALKDLGMSNEDIADGTDRMVRALDELRAGMVHG